MNNINEAKAYKYVLSHGFGPGTLPKDVEILDHYEEGYCDVVYLSRKLTSDEVEEYDISYSPVVRDEDLDDSHKVSYSAVRRDYHKIEQLIISGYKYELYEHNELGDETSFVLVCLTPCGKDYCCYTYESMKYTLYNLLHEYCIYELV